MNSSEIFTFVPSYNHAPFVEFCLKSIIKQTLQPKKLLVIDDGSKDDSIKIIERILKDCPFDAELIVRENRGLCATLNEGFAHCNAEYFAYLGSDDIWLPEFLEHRTRLMSVRPNAVLGYGHAYFINEKNEIFDNTADYTEAWANYPDGNARQMLLQGIAPISSTVFYRSSALEKVRWNTESRLEDYEMYLKLSALGEFAFDNQVLSTWRQHGYNTSKDKLLMLNEVIAAQERNFEVLNVNKNELEKVRSQTKFRYAREFLQNGEKKAAWELAKQNWSGANSKAEIIKFLIRMSVPMFVVEAKRRGKNVNKIEKYQNILPKFEF
jgi:alpha-1,3-rhamnosyltransferase